MIWLNLNALESKLAKYRIGTQTAFKYLVTYLIILIILIYLPRDSSFPFDWWDFTELLLVLLISVIGLKKIFVINHNGDNREFLKRFISLSFVTGLRLIISIMVVWLAYKIIMFIIPLELFVPIERTMNHSAMKMILVPLLVIIFFYLLTRSFRRINSGRYLLEKEMP